VAATVAHDEHIEWNPKRLGLPFTLEDLQDKKGPETVYDKEVEGAGYIEREDGPNEVNVIQLNGLNVDNLLQKRSDLRAFDGSGVYIQFESSENNEIKFNDELAKDLEISKYGANKYLNEDANMPDFTFFPRKRPEDAEDAIQAINAIVDAGDAAEE
jgi:hypothetical protein